MKPSAYFINVARGEIVDQAALVDGAPRRPHRRRRPRRLRARAAPAGRPAPRARQRHPDAALAALDPRRRPPHHVADRRGMLRAAQGSSPRTWSTPRSWIARAFAPSSPASRQPHPRPRLKDLPHVPPQPPRRRASPPARSRSAPGCRAPRPPSPRWRRSPASTSSSWTRSTAPATVAGRRRHDARRLRRPGDGGRARALLRPDLYPPPRRRRRRGHPRADGRDRRAGARHRRLLQVPAARQPRQRLGHHPRLELRLRAPTTRRRPTTTSSSSSRSRPRSPSRTPREIAGVEGVDVVFIGPTDLSGSIGLPGQTGAPEVEALIARAVEAARAAGKPLASVPRVGRSWQQILDDGFAMVASGSEIFFYRQAVAAMMRYRGAGGAAAKSGYS